MNRMVLLLYIADCDGANSYSLLRTSIWCRSLPITRGYCCPRRSHTVLIGRIIERPPRGWPIAMTRARVGRLMRGNGTGVWLLVGCPRLSRCPRPTAPRGRWLWRGTRVVVAARGSVRLWYAGVVVHLLLNLLSRWRRLLVVVRIAAVDLLLTVVVMRRRRC